MKRLSFLIEHLVLHYFNVTDYTTLCFLQQTSEEQLNIILQSIIKKDWQTIIDTPGCDITSESCLWILGVENLYYAYYIIVIKDYFEPVQELIFQLQLGKNDFDKILFVEVKSYNSLQIKLKKCGINVAQSISKLFG